MKDISRAFSLFEKYNVSGPRYTSYPTAVQFAEFSNNEANIYLENYNRNPRKLSLYVHLPFCQSQCFYCGCTTVITKKEGVSREYLDVLKKEIAFEASRSHPESTVFQLHYGGGTPTYFSPEELRELTLFIRSKFNFSVDAECSIELDPRTVTEAHLDVMAEVGFNRASLGVQDVNEEVQVAINRIQPLSLSMNVMEGLRKRGFSSINIDLIYGLPAQTPHRFEKTLDAVDLLSPDRIALYSYAHVPWMKKNQRLLDINLLPSPEEKLTMLMHGIERLTKENWEYIGMDHFARPWDELSKAMHSGDLHRNFQGFSTLSGLDMMAFGMSGIAQMGSAYLQRHRDKRDWAKSVEVNQSEFGRGYFLSKDDEIRKKVIMDTMCSGVVDWDEIGMMFQIDARFYFEKEISKLSDFEVDGLLVQGHRGFIVSTLGRLFLRNIAMNFDAYLPKKSEKSVFSKTV